eukprot:9095104-Lingulodinium_polyedra.AAC.1
MGIGPAPGVNELQRRRTSPCARHWPLVQRLRNPQWRVRGLVVPLAHSDPADVPPKGGELTQWA